MIYILTGAALVARLHRVVPGTATARGKLIVAD